MGAAALDRDSVCTATRTRRSRAERVIQSYRLFMRARKDLAGLVAPDLAAWRYWDAVPEYAALMKSDLRQQGPSRFAIAVYLQQSRGAGEASRPVVPDWGERTGGASR